jgi:hypothetical protein
MRFYKLELKLWDDKVIDQKSNGSKVYPQANGEKISNSDDYLGINGKIRLGNYVDTAPVFDYFYLYNSSYRTEYDWVLLDAYSFIGGNTPSIRGFLISEKFKHILDGFIIAKPYRFYASKLMYQGKKLDYFIFHLAQDEWKEFQAEKSSFYSVENGERKKLDVVIRGNRDLKKLMGSYENGALTMDLHMPEYADVFFFSQFNYVVSERLKKAMEKGGVEGFGFEPLESVSFNFTSMAA